MRGTILLSVLSIAVTGLCMAGGLSTHDPASAGCLALAPDPDACWSQPGDLNQATISSMYVDIGDLVISEVANDFILYEDSEIVLVRWWTGVW